VYFSDLEDQTFLAGVVDHLNIRTYITYKGQRSSYVYNNCTAPYKNPRVIKLTQGLISHEGEDDFEFNVKLGNEDIKLTSTSPLLAGEMLYCSDIPLDQELPVSVSAVEKDMGILKSRLGGLTGDDVYTNTNGEKTMAIGAERTFQLQRKRWLRNPSISNVRVRVSSYEAPAYNSVTASGIQ
jgi:hypothetical protein